MNELIKRLREGVADTGHLIKSAASVNATMYEAADALEQQAKQIEELAAALAEKDAALKFVRSIIVEAANAGFALDNESWPDKLFSSQSMTYDALALQPHASLVAKIKADAVREFGFGKAISHYANAHADRIERGDG